jgi:hypothetical protein
MSDRYLRIVLTVIALELAWIGIKDTVVTPVAAQQSVTPVIIRGFDPQPGMAAYLPVAVAGEVRNRPGNLQPLRALVDAERPVRVDIPAPITARVPDAIRLVTSPQQPLDVRVVPAAGTARPGL